ncbi:MAG: tRNA dihydrouridine synthase DusB [Bdellovibrionales bacterium]
MSRLLDTLKLNPFVLAPMAGITDCAFRSFMKEMGTSIVVSELVSANGLEYDSPKTKQLMRFEEIQRPIGIQLFGETPEIIARGAQAVEQMGADFVDLNFGCPVPKVVKKGAGAATLRDLSRLQEILSCVKKAINIPLTIKIRTGWDEDSRNAHEVVHVAYNEGIEWVAIHGRTRAQQYEGKADWEYIAEVKAKSKIPILGNGDIANAEMAVRRLEETGCDGVLIGRGCLKNPWIFTEALTKWRKEDAAPIQKDFHTLFLRLRGHLEKHVDERVLLIQMKKFSSWFSAGYPGASQFRRDLFTSKSLEEVYGTVDGYFAKLSTLPQQDTSSEAFLMGGHG